MNAAPPKTIAEVNWAIARDPLHYIVAAWNWKTAVAGGLSRTAVFLLAVLRGGLSSAVASSGVELLLAIAMAGCMGAIAQAHRFTRPLWAAAAVVGVESLALSQLLEWSIHLARGTPHAFSGILASAVYSIAASAISIALMRRGLLLTSRKKRPSRGMTFLAGNVSSRIHARDITR